MFGTFTSIEVLIVFLIPGYVWRSVEAQFIYLDHRLPWEKHALSLLARSTFLYLPFFPLLYLAWNQKWYDLYPLYFSISALLFIGALPAFLGLIFGIARQKDFLGTLTSWPWIDTLLTRVHLKSFREHRIPTAWEAIFNAKLDACWVIVTRKNGEQIRGLLGPDSHISIDPEVRDIFISHTLYFDVETQDYKFVPGTKGIYIKADEISTIELVSYEPLSLPQLPSPTHE